jgi:acetylornithine/N-succinyldiaminopimelate aminotransferase
MPPNVAIVAPYGYSLSFSRAAYAAFLRFSGLRFQESKMTALMNTYGRQPVTFVSGQGVWLTDTDGKRYLDAVSGVGVVALGHCHPAVTETISRQAATLVHTSNLYHIAAQEKLGEKLCSIAQMERAFFCNSGAEANEAAIKLARLYGDRKGVESPAIIVMEHSFHGRTLATLSASGNRKIQAGFEPLVAGFVRAPFNDIDAVRTIAQNNRHVVAVLLEPVQGEGGLHTLGDDYLAALRQICDAQGWLLMLDEVQTGNARTGAYFCYQHYGVLPDVVVTAKGLGNGLPIGACLARGVAAELFQPGNHGSTFGGNPLVCATALTVIETIEQQNIAANAARQGTRIREQLQQKLQNNRCVRELRGKGLMIGIELDRPCAELVGKALERGMLINVTSERVVRLLPPLIITDAEADQIADTVATLINEFAQSA